MKKTALIHPHPDNYQGFRIFYNFGMFAVHLGLRVVQMGKYETATRMVDEYLKLKAN